MGAISENQKCWKVFIETVSKGVMHSDGLRLIHLKDKHFQFRFIFHRQAKMCKFTKKGEANNYRLVELFCHAFDTIDENSFE